MDLLLGPQFRVSSFEFQVYLFGDSFVSLSLCGERQLETRNLKLENWNLKPRSQHEVLLFSGCITRENGVIENPI